MTRQLVQVKGERNELGHIIFQQPTSKTTLKSYNTPIVLLIKRVHICKLVSKISFQLYVKIWDSVYIWEMIT